MCDGPKLSGSDAARALGQASLSPMLEGEGSFPVRDVAFSPLILCDTDWRADRLSWDFFRLLRFAPPPSGTLKIKNRFQTL